MGLVLDTSILIEAERDGEGIEDILNRARIRHGEFDVALSAISVVELTRGIYRARTDRDRERRRVFVEGAIRNLIVHPISIEIAELSGRIEGEHSATSSHWKTC